MDSVEVFLVCSPYSGWKVWVSEYGTTRPISGVQHMTAEDAMREAATVLGKPVAIKLAVPLPGEVY